jgi:hypothetical protein
MASAELTILLCFHPVWMCLLIFCHVIITLFAICTCQCNLYAHTIHLRFLFVAQYYPLMSRRLSRHKKKALFLCLINIAYLIIYVNFFFTKFYFSLIMTGISNTFYIIVSVNLYKLFIFTL